MKERPVRTEPKSSETDPPAANQPVDHDEQGSAGGTAKATPGGAAGHSSASTTPQVAPRKPDGEVDTRR